jgi:DNA-binding winged helix-turn-helix (wHTH) protein
MSDPGRILRFGIFELHVQTGELRKRGVKLRLQGKPLQILQALVERPGEVVTREAASFVAV